MTLRWVPGWNGLTEPEAVSYVAAVEAADGQELEFGVARAINDFVTGCKTDGIWDAIKACCILAGARTLDAALVPLVGTAPTNNNFVSGDYNRETGLVGDGSTKYLDSNRNNNADPQDSKHLSAYISTLSNQNGVFRWSIGDLGFSVLGQTTTNKHYGRLNDSDTSTPGLASPELNFTAIRRNASTGKVIRLGGIDYPIAATSSAPNSGNYFVFRRNDATVPGYSNARLAFYSIGESLDLAALDTRVSNLITAIGAAIP
jgi:hypothetical protein